MSDYENDGNEEFGGSEYIGGFVDASELGKSEPWYKNCWVKVLIAVLVVFVVLLIVNATANVKIFWDNTATATTTATVPFTMKSRMDSKNIAQEMKAKLAELKNKIVPPAERLTVTVKEDPERMRKRERATVTVTDERFVSDSSNNDGMGPSGSDINSASEVYGNINLASMDPAVQKVIGNYSDFKTANDPGQRHRNMGRKGMNTNDAGGNRFAGTETHANQEGSLWTKPSEQGSFVERMESSSGSKWTGKFSEAGLDPNSMYVANNTEGQQYYDWGFSSARTPRGKTDVLLESAAAGF